jgi:hypothetical protein
MSINIHLVGCGEVISEHSHHQSGLSTATAEKASVATMQGHVLNPPVTGGNETLETL